MMIFDCLLRLLHRKSKKGCKVARNESSRYHGQAIACRFGLTGIHYMQLSWTRTEFEYHSAQAASTPDEGADFHKPDARRVYDEKACCSRGFDSRIACPLLVSFRRSASHHG